MATSVERYNVAVNQQLIGKYVKYKEDDSGKLVAVGSGAAAAAQDLAPLLDMDEAELGGKLLGGDEKRPFCVPQEGYLPRALEEDPRASHSRNRAGTGHETRVPQWQDRGQRHRVHGHDWHADRDDTPEQAVGQAGIERSLNDVLTGEDGQLSVQIAGGAVLPSGDRSETPAKDGE